LIYTPTSFVPVSDNSGFLYQVTSAGLPVTPGTDLEGIGGVIWTYGSAVGVIITATRVPVPGTGTIRNMILDIQTNSLTTANMLISVAVNGNHSLLQAVVAPGFTGQVPADVPVSVVDSDLVNFRVTTDPGGAGSAVFSGTFEFIS
jgi:hypothetical protein